jgi:hypothetical protein
MRKPSWTLPRWIVLSLVAVVALVLSTTQAAGYVRIASAPDMAYVDAKDDQKPIKDVGLDLGYDGGLVVMVTAKGGGALGNAKVAKYGVDDLPINALEDHDLDRCACWLGVVQEYLEGVTFEVDKATLASLVPALQGRLTQLGFTVDACAPGARAFHFTRDGVTYRAVLHPVGTGTRVYLGI